jgi:hypothetical protein
MILGYSAQGNLLLFLSSISGALRSVADYHPVDEFALLYSLPIALYGSASPPFFGHLTLQQ